MNKSRISNYFGFKDYENSVKSFNLDIYNAYTDSLTNIAG